MRNLALKTFLLVFSGLVYHAAFAMDVTVDGSVVAVPCTVDSGSVSQDVDFGQVRSTDLKDIGSSSLWQPFEVKLTNCPLGTTSATATFSGTVSTDDATLYANSGTAANVAVQMAQTADKSVVQGNGSSMTVNVDAQRNAVYSLSGRLLSVAGNTGAGTFASVVQISFAYQ